MEAETSDVYVVPVQVCVCVCVCMHGCLCVCVCVCVCMCACMCACLCVCECVCLWETLFPGRFVSFIGSSKSGFSHVHADACTYRNMDTHPKTRGQRHVYKHAAHTNTRKHHYVDVSIHTHWKLKIHHSVFFITLNKTKIRSPLFYQEAQSLGGSNTGKDKDSEELGGTRT